MIWYWTRLWVVELHHCCVSLERKYIGIDNEQDYMRLKNRVDKLEDQLELEEKFI